MHELLGTPRDFVLIVFRTVVVYLAILVGFRLIGKREVGQLAPFDLALMLLIAAFVLLDVLALRFGHDSRAQGDAYYPSALSR